MDGNGFPDCPICKTPLDEDFVVVERNGEKEWIHRRHPNPASWEDNKWKHAHTSRSQLVISFGMTQIIFRLTVLISAAITTS